MRQVRAVLVTLTLLASVALTWAGPAQATYAGKDGKIAFVRSNQIYTMTSTGASVTKLTSTGKNYRPSWSPDGKRISYINETSAGKKNVWVMSATGSSKQQVTTTGAVTSAGAEWSADGKTLAFATTYLYTVKSTAPFGTPVQALHNTVPAGECEIEPGPVRVDQYLAWSPDGTRIAVHNQEDCHVDSAVWWYYPATHEYVEQRASGGDCCGYLDWKDLFFAADNTFGYSELDYGDSLEFPNPPSHIVFAGFASSGGDTGAAPSPSGKYVVLANSNAGTAEIYRTARNGGQRTYLTNGYQPDWQRTS